MLILAPMQGLTELVFRNAFHRSFPGAFDYAVSPFISLTHGNIKNADKKLFDVLPERNRGSMAVIPQLLGHEPVEFVDMMDSLNDLGYNEVSWNIGCPMRRVAAKHRGSGILPYPDEVKRVLEYVCPRIKNRLSIKTRLGYRLSDEIDSLIPIFNDYPLSNVTIHPRIGKQLYSGIPNLEKLDSIVPLFKHRLIYNGDICTVGDYQRIRLRYPNITDVMIGRGALYNPLLPMQIRSPRDAVFEQTPIYDFILSLFRDITEMEIPHQSKIRKIKEYWCLLSKGLPGTETMKRQVLRSDDLELIQALVFEMTK